MVSDKMPVPEKHGLRSYVALVAAFAIIAFFTFLSLLSIHAPGLYMDAVDPDYDVVKLLNPTAPVSEWLPPGNLLWDRFPILAGPYSGSYAVYWGAIFYAMMNGSVESIRVAHLSIGILILCAVGFLAKRMTASNWLALATMAVLALDPAFVFVFRTQAYMQMIGLVFLLSALISLRGGSAKSYILAGAFAGLAAFGYFVFFFTWPGFLLFAIFDPDGTTRLKKVAALCGGFFLGCLPYIFGFGMIFNSLGNTGAMMWLHSFFGAVAPNSGQANYIERLTSVSKELWLVFSNSWQWLTFFGSSHDEVGQTIKVILLVVLPIAGLFFLRATEMRRSFVLVACPLLSFIVAATFFGDRLGGHEFPELIPLAYLLSAVAAMVIVRALQIQMRLGAASLSICVLIVGIANIAGTATEAKALEHDGAKGLFSAIVSTFPETVLASNDSTPYIFWSWGEMMPFIYQTRGKIPAYDASQLLTVACKFGHANVVFLGDETVEKNSGGVFPKSAITVVQTRDLKDPQSGFPLHVLSVKAANPRQTCASADTVAKAGAPAGPKAISLTPEIQVKGVSFTSNPPQITGAKASGLSKVVVNWRAPSAKQIAIHMGAPDGALFTTGPNAGNAETGLWIQPGVVFFLQDVTDGSPGKTLAKITVAACEKCKP